MLTFYETCEDECTVSLNSCAHLLIANVGVTSVSLLLCQFAYFVRPEIPPASCLRFFSFIKKPPIIYLE